VVGSAHGFQWLPSGGCCYDGLSVGCLTL